MVARRVGLVLLVGLCVVATRPAFASPTERFTGIPRFAPTPGHAGGDVTLTGTFTAVDPPAGDRVIELFLFDTGGFGSITAFTTTGNLTGCAFGNGTHTLVICTWTSPAPGDVAAIVGTVAIAVGASGDWSGLARIDDADCRCGIDQLFVVPADPTAVTSAPTTTTVAATTTSPATTTPTSDPNTQASTTASLSAELPATGSAHGAEATGAALFIVGGMAMLALVRALPGRRR